MKSGEIPQTLLDFLLPDEEIIAWTAQNRLKHPISPAVLAATNQRLVAWMPTLGGLKHDIEGIEYRELKDLSFKKGFLMGSVFLAYVDRSLANMEWPEMDNKEGAALVKVANRKIRETMQGQGDAVGRVLRTRADVNVQGALAAAPAAADPLAEAKLRLARGEITADEFKEIKEMLG